MTQNYLLAGVFGPVNAVGTGLFCRASSLPCSFTHCRTQIRSVAAII